jgi:hypothetical protein
MNKQVWYLVNTAMMFFFFKKKKGILLPAEHQRPSDQQKFLSSLELIWTMIKIYVQLGC